MNERYDPIIEADHVCESKHEDAAVECRTERGTYRQLEMILIGQLERCEERTALTNEGITHPGSASSYLGQYMPPYSKKKKRAHINRFRASHQPRHQHLFLVCHRCR